MISWYKRKTINVSPEIMEHFDKQVGPKKGRVSDKDTDKWLEMELCKLAFSNGVEFATVESASSFDDISKDIDCIVNGRPVQVKCRSHSDTLYLEEYKTRNNRKIPGWTLRSKAELYLFVFPNTETSLTVYLIPHKQLKDLLQDLQEYENNGVPGTFPLQKWGILGFQKKNEVVKENGDGLGCFWEVFL